MVDLFAVLAIVFLIYANDEITVNKVESQKEIQKIVAEIQVERETMQQELLEAEQARKDRREFVANKVGKSLEQIEQEREQQAQQLVAQFTKMLAAQQSQAATEYEELVTRYEVEHEQQLEREKKSLQQQKQDEVNQEKAELEEALAQRKSKLEKEKQKALSLAKLEYEKELSSKEKVIEKAQDALVEAEQTRLAQLAKQEAELEKQKRAEAAKVEQARQKEAEQKRVAALAKAEQERVAALRQADQEQAATLARAQQEQANALAKQKSALEEQKRQDVAKARKELAQSLASQQAELEAKEQQALQQAEQAQAQALAESEQQRQKELGDAEKKHAEQLVMAATALAAEKKQALAQAEQASEAELAAQKSELEEEKATAVAATEQEYVEKLDQQKELVAKVAEELVPHVAAQKAKKKIVDQLNENFKDFDDSAVEIDAKTGKVKLHFQESYFVRGSHQLSDDMKKFLKIMIPKYARSIYQNTDAAEHVESLKISGMTSPVYLGMYIDINGTTPRAENAREFNMALSNKRAVAMYEFIFDEDEMGDYKYRRRLKADMGISALGFQNATPVRADLVGKPADCIEYDCKQEQAAVLQFRLITEE